MVMQVPAWGVVDLWSNPCLLRRHLPWYLYLTAELITLLLWV